MSQREQLDDLLDTRAEIRRLRKAVEQTKAAYAQAKGELASATERAEEVLTEIEQKQGRLPFDAEGEKPAKRKPRKIG